MEDHEETVIATAPPEMKPKVWRRYVDDSFEIIKKDQRDPSQNTSIVLTQLVASHSLMSQK